MSELGDGLKNVLLASIGAVALTVEKSKEVVDKLVQKGEAAVEQGKVLNQELKRKRQDKLNELRVPVSVKIENENGETTEVKADIGAADAVEAICKHVGQLTQDELDKIKEKLFPEKHARCADAEEESCCADAKEEPECCCEEKKGE